MKTGATYLSRIADALDAREHDPEPDRTHEVVQQPGPARRRRRSKRTLKERS